MNPLLYRASVAALPLLLALPSAALAQQMPQIPTAGEARDALNPPRPTHYTHAQLDQMLAPIALYPDQLLTQMLMAATFPDQLVDARKWLDDSNNASLKGDDLANALQPLPWDPSVKSLAAFPQLIVMMVDHLDWTEALGTAFANQQVEVFARVQFLRERAVHAGKLKSSPQLAVREQASDIIIEPTDPDQIYVPVYNPAEVYGPWPDRDAPPVYIPPPPRLYSGTVGAAIGFSVGLAVAKPLWGWGHTDWRRHEVIIDRNRYDTITNRTYIEQNHINIEGGAWHRGGPVVIVPEAQRPRPVQVQEQQLPPGTVRPSEVPHPRAQGAPGGQPPGERGQPAPRPGEQVRPQEGQPGPHPGEPPRPQEAHPGGPPPHQQEGQPGPRPGEPPPPQEAHPGGPPSHQQEGQPGPHPGEPPRPQEGHPGGPPPHQQEGQPGPRPGEPQHPQESHPSGPTSHPQEQPAPRGGEQHPGAPPSPPPQQPHPPEQHAPPQEHAAPPQHPAGPPPEAHPAPPQQPPPQQAHPAPPPPPQPPAQPQPPHPQGPPQPPQQAHPAPPQQQGHPGGPPQERKEPKPGEEQPQQR